MVGVAGRSKGCGTCRKRRIRCGLQRPQCSNCIKSNRLCTGYQRERVFIINQTEYTGTNGDKDCSTGSDLNARACDATARTVPVWMHKYKPAKLFQGVSLVPVYRQKLLDTFLRASIPEMALLGPGFTPWTQTLASLPDHTPALATAVVAVSLSRAAKLYSDKALQMQSLEYYTTGLWDLQKALWSPDEMYLDQTLAACLLLAYYELMECPGGSQIGYLNHQDGAARLVQLRGPEAHIEGFGHSLFRAYRTNAILHSMKQHQPSFLSDEKWMTVPYRVHPKTPADKVWDIMAQAPGIYRQTDEMQRSLPVRSLCIALHVLEYCWGIDTALAKWYAELDASVPGPLYWPELAASAAATTSKGEHSTSKDAVDEPALFPVAYHFINLHIASTLLSYWSLQTLVHNGMRLLHLVLATVPVDRKAVAALGAAAPPALLRGINPACPADCACGGFANPDVPCIARFDTGTLRPLGERADVLGPVREICQSVEYCMRPEMADMGWTSVVAPLSIAVESVRDYDWCKRETEWGRGVLKRFENRLPYLKCAPL